MAEGCDIVVGFGDGSSLDVAKLAAVLLRSRQPLAEMYGIDKVEGERTPLVLVPTTAGTGSEVTNISVITTGATTKAGVVSRQLFADFALLDAELTLALPPLHTAATGIDAMVHAIEAYTGRHRKNPVSDAFAREALRLLHANLLVACREGTNREAREGMLPGAALAGQAFANSPVAAVHALAYPIGGRHKVPHGLSNALMLSPVLRFNLPVAASLYAQLSDVIGLPGGASDEAREHLFVNAMAGVLRASGAPSCLREVGIARDDLPLLTRDAMLQQRLLMNNPRDIHEADAIELYEKAY